MADNADQAQDLIEQRMQDALNNREPLQIPYSGYCMFCHTELKTERRFCDASCRELWEAEKGIRPIGR